MQKPSWLEKLKRFDRQRPSMPGEHAWVLAAGIAMLTWGSVRKDRSPWCRAAAGAAGGALLLRAASGRDGLSRLLKSEAQRDPQPPHSD